MARLRTQLFTAIAAFLVAFPVTAQQSSPSVPARPGPVAPVAAESIEDLESSPPIAIEAILLLVGLGAYPLEGTLARPNDAISEAEFAYMLVNAFEPGVSGEFPVDPTTALAHLQTVGGAAAVGEIDGVVTGTEALALIPVALRLEPTEAQMLRALLVERYPAFQRGNFEAPLTRAGAALLIAQVIDIGTQETAG